MSQRIRRFGVGQTAKVFGVMYALLGLVFVPFLLLLGSIMPEASRFSTGMALAIPIIYGFCGFVFTALACAIYNVVAGMVGGIEIEVNDATA